MFRVQIQDLLEDGDRTRVESVLPILLGDLAVLGDGLLDLSPASIGVPHFEQKFCVMRVQLKELVVLLEGLRFRALLRVFSRSLQYFSFVQRQAIPQHGEVTNQWICTMKTGESLDLSIGQQDRPLRRT